MCPGGKNVTFSQTSLYHALRYGWSFTTRKQLRGHEAITQMYGSDPAILSRRGDTWLTATNERMKVKVIECPNSVNSMLHGFYFGCSVLEKVIEETRYRLHYVHGTTIV